MKETKAIIDLLNLYCKAKNLQPETVGRYAIGGSDIILRLQSGRISYQRAARLVEYIFTHWPDGLDWPQNTPRTQKTNMQNAK